MLDMKTASDLRINERKSSQRLSERKLQCSCPVSRKQTAQWKVEAALLSCAGVRKCAGVRGQGSGVRGQAPPAALPVSALGPLCPPDTAAVC